MKFTVLLSILLFSLSVIASPAVMKEGAISLQAISIGDSAVADSKSLLDIKSTSKGVLFPRMTSTQMNAISSPTTGLMVWNTTASGLYQYNGSTWAPVGTLSPLTTKGDLYTYDTTNSRLPVGSNNQLLLADSTQSTGLKWGQASLTASVTGTLPIGNGGTGQTSFSSGILHSNGTVLSSSPVVLTSEVSGTLPIANGGTGQTTANSALNALLPTQTSNSGKFLTTDGSNTSWAQASLQTQGQSEGSSVSTLTLKAPYNQLTTTGTNERLVETGNNNLLLNPSFEHSTFNTSWSDFSLGSSETSVIHHGLKSIKLSPSLTLGTLLTQSVTPTIDLNGTNIEFSIWVKNNNSNVQFCALNGGNEVGTCVSVLTDNIWHQYIINYPGPSSGSVGVKLKTTSSVSGTLYADDAYVGLARNIGTVQQAQYIGGVTISGCASAWTSTSSSYSDFSTVASCVYTADGAVTGPATNIPGMIIPSLGPGRLLLKYIGNLGKQTGTTNDSFFVFYDGTTTTQEATIGNATSQWDIVGTYEGGITYTTAQSNLSVRLRGRNNGASQTVQVFQGRIEAYYFPSQAQTVVKADQANTEWTTYTPATKNGYTASAEDYEWTRVNDSIFIRARITVATTTGTAFGISYPNALTVASSSKISSSATVVGSGARQGTDNIYTVHTSAGSSLLNMGSGSGRLTAVAGNSLFSNGDTISIEAGPIPISGWVTNQNAPLLVGSVTSNTNGLERIERAVFTCSSSSNISSQSGNWVSIANLATDKCRLTFAAGIFSAIPTCVVSYNSANATIIYSPMIGVLSSTTADFTGTYTASPFSLTKDPAAVVNLICMGPR